MQRFSEQAEVRSATKDACLDVSGCCISNANFGNAKTLEARGFRSFALFSSLAGMHRIFCKTAEVPRCAEAERFRFAVIPRS